MKYLFDAMRFREFACARINHNSWVNTGVTIHDQATGGGVGLCPVDSPMVSLGEPGEYKFSSRYEPEKPWVYLNLYNNHWRTNFAAWVGDGSPMSSRVVGSSSRPALRASPT